jgi:uncharacterized protein
MQYSAHNILSQVRDSKQWFLVNLLSGHADMLDAEIGERTSRGELPSEDALEDWQNKGYVVDPLQEEKLYRAKYLDFLDDREKDEVQIFFVPWYSCNFSCTYCFQESYGWTPVALNPEIVDAFFQWVREKFPARKKYITLFGGEPLMPVAAMRQFVIDFLQKAKVEDLDLAIVTNGYNLIDYLDVLSDGNIREIQVTLDGPQDAHDQRRMLRGGGKSFARIVEGIDAALSMGMTINLRMVVDRENLHTLPDLARFAVEKGWTKNPHFKTQLGRNYELHTCQVGNERLYSRVELYQELYGLVQKFPEILEFHKPAFSISRFLFENGELPAPLFDACTGTKTEWALDGTGRIYSCTATVGKQDEELGTFWPAQTENRPVLEQWESRDVCSISECTTCNVRLACGGGCASVAKNASGQILSPDCRPVQKLLEMGVALYGPNPGEQ